MKTVVIIAIMIALVELLASPTPSSGLIEEQNIMHADKGETVIPSSEAAAAVMESLLASSGNRKMVAMMILAGPQRNCIPTGQPCGLLHQCCDGNYCTDPFSGTCTVKYCVPQGQPCGVLHPCCVGMCPDMIYGTCRQ